jgi:hypothetical protein
MTGLETPEVLRDRRPGFVGFDLVVPAFGACQDSVILARSPRHVLAISLLPLALPWPMRKFPGPGHFIRPLLRELGQRRRPGDRADADILADLVVILGQVIGFFVGEGGACVVRGAEGCYGGRQRFAGMIRRGGRPRDES